MKISNQTRHTILIEEVIEPKKLWDQSLGLLKYKTPVAMLLRTRYGIHTFSMRYSIDILILDKRNRVVKKKENLQPNRIFLWNPKYEIVLELPVGCIKKSKTQKNDTLIFAL